MPVSDNSSSGGSKCGGNIEQQPPPQSRAAKLLADSKNIINPLKNNKQSGNKKQPLVVIPKRRKHKNYISRRKGNKAAASLRKCNSDPQLYRGFNHWHQLCILDDDNNKEEGQKLSQQRKISSGPTTGKKISVSNKLPQQDTESFFKNRIQELDAAAAKLLSVAQAAQDDERKQMASSASERLDALGVSTPQDVKQQSQQQIDNRVEDLKIKLEEIMVSKNAPTPPKKISAAGLKGTTPTTPSSMAKGTSIRLAQERLAFAAAGKQHTTAGIPRNINIGKIGTIPSLDVTCSPQSTSEAIEQQKSPLVMRKTTKLVDGIEPIHSKDNSSEVIAPANPVLERKLSTKRRRIEDLARIKEELRNAKLPSVDALSRKKAREKKKEELEDAQAKNTVDAVAAAFQQGHASEGVYAKNSIVGLAAKPPASPSMLARRELNRLANRRNPDDEEQNQQEQLQPPQPQLPHSHSGSTKIGSGDKSPTALSPSLRTRQFGIPSFSNSIQNCNLQPAFEMPIFLIPLTLVPV